LVGLALAAPAVGCRHRGSDAGSGTEKKTQPNGTIPALSSVGGGPTDTPAAHPSPAGTPVMPDVPALVASVKPAVVNITSIHEVRVPQSESEFGFDFFGIQPFGPRQQQFGDRVIRQRSLGSGFIVDGAGHVVTNAHVVEQAQEVRVKLSDEREFPAVVKGRDSRLDVAVLELSGANRLPSVSLGSSEDLKVGEYVIAIGNPFGLGDTVTMGIVSAKSRTIGAGPYDDFIQTDASINPGNSGGPLFNLKGQVVGINTAINPSGQGIGFAIPIDDVKQAIPQLLATGHVARGRLGVVVQPMDEQLAKAVGLDRPRGAMIAEVEAAGPAGRAGIRPGDVVLAVDGTPVNHSVELPRIVANHAPASTVTLTVWRDRSERPVQVTLDELTEKEPRQEQGSQQGQGPAPKTSGVGARFVDSPRGVVVAGVASGGPSEGELREGDVIVEVNRVPVARASEAMSQIQKTPVGQPVLMKVKREGSTRFVAVERR
jgi:serine protease Do